MDLKYYVGQEHARRALEVAAAGDHRAILIGAPGAGKSQLVACFEAMLPGISARCRTGRPCPCGYYGDTAHKCTCSTGSIIAYRTRNYGAHLDGFDMTIEVARLPIEKMELILRPTDTQSRYGPWGAESSADVLARIEACRAIQAARGGPAAGLSPEDVNRYCRPDDAGRALITRAAERLGLSMRAFTGILRVARTIADLAGAESIQVPHIAEACQYRSGTERLLG